MAQHSNHKILSKIAIAATLLTLVAPAAASAAGSLTNRSVTLGSSTAAATSVTYAYAWKAGTTDTVKAVKFEVCDSPIESTGCVNTTQSAGASFAGASIAGSPSPTGVVGFSNGTASANSFLITKAAGVAETGGTTTNTISIAGITNPSSANQQFYLRVTTYNSDTTQNGTTEVDFGAVAVSTGQPLTLTGIVPPTLQFCVGVTVNATCSSISGSTVDFGYFSPSSTVTATSMMAASTNAQGGYNVTVNGSTLTSGIYTFPQMGTQSLNANNSTAPSIGASEFGQNVTVSSGSGSGTAFQAYGNSGQYRFFTGDTVASASAATAGNAFTNTYAVDMSGAQAAGTYTTTLTYVCTGMF
jgi:hypothetical protein